MKVIKYGPGYEPRTKVCTSCKSVLEYGQDDIQHYNSTVKTEDNVHKQMFLEYIVCPLCKSWSELSMELTDTSKYIPPPPSAPPLRVIYERFRNKPT